MQTVLCLMFEKTHKLIPNRVTDSLNDAATDRGDPQIRHTGANHRHAMGVHKTLQYVQLYLQHLTQREVCPGAIRLVTK